MTALDDVTIPPCPACGGDGHRTPTRLRHLGAYECLDGLCASFYSGTTSEWMRYEQMRDRRSEGVERDG